jgi:antitoxin (DNA-binding transcriptional repressor) of toxin-antitoxin stability system
MTPQPEQIVEVTMTQLRRELADLADLAAAGQTVVITKGGIPFLQLIPVQHQYHPPRPKSIDMTAIAATETPELIELLTQAKSEHDEPLALGILAELGNRMVREAQRAQQAKAFTDLQQH